MMPRYPIFIVSKGRAKNMLTARALDRMGVPYRLIVEESEREQYAERYSCPIHVLPQSYLDEYDTCDELGDSKSKGPGAARNCAWDLATQEGLRARAMDDNIDAFHYLNRRSGRSTRKTCAAEDFVDRYSNVPVAGFNYYLL